MAIKAAVPARTLAATLFKACNARGRLSRVRARDASIMYGTSTTALKKVLSENKVCLMDLDLVGAQNLRKHPTLRSVVLFVSPPNFDVLEKRLRERGTETEDRITKRLKNAVAEVQWHQEHDSFFDGSLVNDDLDACYADFRKVVLENTFKLDMHSR